MPQLQTDRTTIERTLLAQLGITPSGRHTDGTLPHFFWVSPGGSDGVGNGSLVRPFLTITRAVQQCVDGRGDYVLVSPGEYAETVHIGLSTSSTTVGEAGGTQKRDVKIIGTGGAHPGRCQLVGTTTQAKATLTVDDGYLRGFMAKNISLDTGGSSATSSPTGIAYPCLELVTNDADAFLSATSNEEWFNLENIYINSGNSTPPSVGMLFRGATMGRVKKCRVAGVTHGIVFVESTSNRPEGLEFEDIDFADNTTADIATAITVTSGVVALGACNLTNVNFARPKFWDRGGTPVTNYVNMVGTMVNVHLFDFRSARAVADDTLMALPVDLVAIGWDANSSENIIGS